MSDDPNAGPVTLTKPINDNDVNLTGHYLGTVTGVYRADSADP